MRDVLRGQIDHLDRAVAVSPDFMMADGQHAVGARGVVVTGKTDESTRELRQGRIRRGVDKVDSFIGVVAEDVNSDDGIDKADVERLDFLTARQGDNRYRRQCFVDSPHGGVATPNNAEGTARVR